MLCTLGLWTGPATAGDAGRVSLIVENDAFVSSDDRHYTQGARLSYLSGDIAAGSGWNRPFDAIGGVLPLFAEDGSQKRKINTVVGQSIFTPADLHAAMPDPTDRPYAGWLYLGAALLQDRDGRSLEGLEMLLGVVGPLALGKPAQDTFHGMMKLSQPQGWRTQLNDEPGLVISYERRWRFEQPLVAGLAADFVPELGATLGNVFTYGAAGGMLRFGQGLGADYGPPRIRPTLSGADWFDADRMQGPVGWYVFIGSEGRAMGRNIFLDGNTWQRSPSVAAKPLVADIVYGASVFWSDKLRVDLAITERTKQFYGQRSADRFGTVTLSCLFP